MVEDFCGSKCGRLAGEKHGVDGRVLLWRRRGEGIFF